MNSTRTYKLRTCKYSGLLHCPYCGDDQFNSGLKIGGHIQFCKFRYVRTLDSTLYTEDSLEEEEFENYDFSDPDEHNAISFELNEDFYFENDTSEEYLDFTSDSFVDQFVNANERYLKRQYEIMDLEEYKRLEAGNVLMLNNLKRPASIQNYFEIAEYASSNYLSSGVTDELLQLIRRVSIIDGKEIPVPKRYSTIMDRIMTVLRKKEIRILRNKYPHSEEIFGPNHNLPDINAVVTDIVEVACSMLVDPDLMGEGNCNFHGEYEEKVVVYEKRIGRKKFRVTDTVYSEFYNSQWFKMAEDKIRREWGSVNICCIQLHLDETQMSTNRGVNSTPCYLSVLNFDSDTLRSKEGITLCGYSPVTNVTKAVMQSKLERMGVTSRDKQALCMKVHSRWLQQQFLRDLLNPIIEMNDTGPVLCQIGYGESSSQDWTMFLFCGIAGDNMGHLANMCLCGLGSEFSCRLCYCGRTELQNPYVLHFQRRCGIEEKAVLEKAFEIFCASLVRGGKLSQDEQSVLDYCEEKCIFPIKPALMDVQSPFDGFSPYEYLRPDLQHTVQGRLKSSWIFQTVVATARISSTRKREYRDNLALLDDALMNFLPKHSLPFDFDHFETGVTTYCYSATDSRAMLTTSGLGKIDHQRVPSLVLQMLICIGERDDILPLDEEDEDLDHDLKSCILATGWLLLDAYLSLSRKAMSSIELSIVEELIKLSNYCSLEMQVWKNKMLHKSIKQYPREIKPHITSHFIEFWARDGSARLFNTYMLEAAHPQQVKNVYHGSSRRRGTILSEMFLRYIRMKLVKQGKAEFNRVRGNDDMLRRLQNFDSDSRDSKIRFETEAGVVVECSTLSCDTEELKYCSRNHDLRFVSTGANREDYLNPFCSLSFVYEQLLNNDDLQETLDSFRASVPGYKMMLQKYFKVDSREQGIPIFYIYAFRKFSPRSPNSMRFDWLKNTNGDYIQVAALIALIGPQQTYLLTVGYHAEECKSNRSLYPLPKIKYSMTAAYKSRMSADFVDTIDQPVAVIPCSLRYEDYFVGDKRSRSRVIFCTIPVGFLYRDDWPNPESNVALNTFHDTVIKIFNLKEYKSGDLVTREGMYNKLIEIMWSIGKEGGLEIDEEEVFEEVIEFTIRRKRLEVRPSSYLTRRTKGEIGQGLYCIEKIPQKNVISFYIGEKITVAEWERRKSNNCGGYGVELTRDVILDCRRAYEIGKCVASAANSYRNLIHQSTLESARPNAKLVVKKRIAYLISICDIMPGCEILLDYGVKYKEFLSMKDQAHLTDV